MLDKLNAQFDDILKLVKKCPTPELQEVALKALLENWFRLNMPLAPATGANAGTQGAPGTGTPDVTPAQSQFPPTFNPFMVANSLTAAQLGRVFNPLGPGAQLVLGELTGKGKGGKEVTLALVLSVRQAMAGGTFGCTLQELRQMCVHYNCYDISNFAAHLNNNADLFKPRKKGEDIELSASGMKRAADIIKGVNGE